MGTFEYDLNKRSYQVIIFTFLNCDKGIIVTLDNVLILEDAEIFKRKMLCSLQITFKWFLKIKII